MAPLLDDEGLHIFTGGHPPTAQELAARYRRWATGISPGGDEAWLNWVMRRRDTAAVVGTVQATVRSVASQTRADLAWVVGRAQQGRGFAQEAARAMVAWLWASGVTRLCASIHPAHAASMAVARAVGLHATETIVDGEVLWCDAGSTGQVPDED